MLAMPGDVAGDALLVLGEALPLLELSDVDSGEGSSGAGFHQQKDGGSPDAASTAARLGAYLVGISDALSGAAVAASVDGVDDSLPTSDAPGPALGMTAVMMCAAVRGDGARRRRGRRSREAGPRLETAAIDGLLAAAVPGLRACLAARRCSRDGVEHAGPAAVRADAALNAAATAARDDAATAARAPADAAGLALAAFALDFIAEEEAEPLAARLVATVLTA